MSPTSPDRSAVRADPVRVSPVLVVSLLVAVGITVVFAVLRGGLPFAALGVSGPPVEVAVATPLARLVTLLAAGATVGGLVGAVVARPSRDGELGAQAYAAVRWVGAAAAVWAVGALVAAVLTVLAGTGSDPRILTAPDAFLTSAAALEEPAGFLVAAVLAAVVAALCRLTLSWRTAAGALPLAVLGVVAPAVTGQVASARSGHDIATDAAALAAVAAAVWLGLALLETVQPGRALAARARPIALVAAGTALAGTVVAEAVLVRGAWFSGVHGPLALVQLALLAGAAVLTLRGRVPGPSVAALLVPAVGLGALLATELPPALTAPVLTTLEGIQDAALGYRLDPPTLLGLLGPGRLNLLWAVVAVVLAGAYLAGVRRLRARGDAWPPGRTASWLGACALLLWATSSGLGAHSMATFSVHMGVHMILSMGVPILLVLGGPVTLALRALPTGDTGPRAWLLSLLDAPLTRLLTHPLVALALFVGSFYALYFSALYATALPFHWAHQLMFLHFMVTGSLFFWPIIGVDRAPRPLPHLGRLAMLLASMPFHAFFAVALMSTDVVIGQAFFGQIALPWVPDLLADQRLGGGIAWASGEAPLVVVLLVLLVQWSRADSRDATRRDRHADRDGDAELAAWNRMLADLSRGR
ncbi:putative copper resistance protein D [Actinomycetospora succinea]|uniref:Putative copper resistance protein D n=1 Tax=Actinomycetospora succinea TaxID=663603 RepID=A0A4R6UPW2_9PSEU|nr:cytochrome c oxidase assembly protein [Actinomycetospora succinea]TDQ48952.1 putative copper resistance protein D [Actinomycetospora succinea]